MATDLSRVYQVKGDVFKHVLPSIWRSEAGKFLGPFRQRDLPIAFPQIYRRKYPGIGEIFQDFVDYGLKLGGTHRDAIYSTKVMTIREPMRRVSRLPNAVSKYLPYLLLDCLSFVRRV